MEGRGNNKRFEDVFKKMFPKAYERRQQQLKNKTKSKKYKEKRGMGPEEFFNKDKKKSQEQKEKDLWGEPDQVMKFKRGPWTVVRKVWNTNEGMKMKEYTENNDGSLNDQGGPLGGANPFGFGNMMGFIVDPRELMNQFSNMNENMEDPDMSEEEIFEQMFGMQGDEGNHFSFDDPPTPYNTEHLEQMLKQAEEEEDYETAAQIRDLLDQDSRSDDSDEE